MKTFCRECLNYGMMEGEECGELLLGCERCTVIKYCRTWGLGRHVLSEFCVRLGTKSGGQWNCVYNKHIVIRMYERSQLP